MRLTPERKRLFRQVAAAVMGIGVLTVIFLWLTTSTIAVTSQPDAQIFIRQDGSESEYAGTGRAVFRTRSSATVFVEARAEGRVTQQAVKPRRARTTAADLQLRELAETRAIAEGPLIFPHIEKGFIYGINPRTKSLAVNPLGRADRLEPALPNLPFVKRIIWLGSASHFLYVSQGRGTGVIGGRQPRAGLPYTDAALLPGTSDLALLAADGVYLARRANFQTASKIADTTANSAPSIFADGGRIFFASLIFEELEQEADQPRGVETRLLVFGRGGEQQHDFRLELTEPIYKIVALDDDTAGLLTGTGLTELELASGKTAERAFDFGRVRDLIVFRDRRLLLSETGLWEYDAASGASYKIAGYPTGEEYTDNSLAVINGALYFSTSIKRDELLKDSTAARSSVYRVVLE
jgi:hypothetical protein